MAELGPKVVGCTCDFSGGTRGMDRCHRCDGTGSRFIVVSNGEGWYYPNTRKGYVEAMHKLGRTPEGEEVT
jgi:hypothetical protein